MMQQAMALLKEISNEYQQILNDRLVGIYVHGSLAFGCFHWENSDIDFLVVVDRPLPVQTRVALMEALVARKERAPKKGLEMSVIERRFLSPFVYPTPYELHYSNMWTEVYQTDPLAYCADRIKCDPDLAAHCTVCRQVGFVLAGRPISEVFGEVPAAEYLDSLLYDIQDAEAEILTAPTYIILNLARVLAYLRDGAVLSKEQGGFWGIQNIPTEFTGLVESALKNYQAQMPFAPDSGLALSYCRFMLCAISSNVPTKSHTPGGR